MVVSALSQSVSWCTSTKRDAPVSMTSVRGETLSVLFRVQLVEPLYDHVVDFLKIIYVLSLGCQPSRHVLHLRSCLNLKVENRLLQ